MLDYAKAMSRVAKQDVGVCDRPVMFNKVMVVLGGDNTCMTQ